MLHKSALQTVAGHFFHNICVHFRYADIVG